MTRDTTSTAGVDLLNASFANLERMQSAIGSAALSGLEIESQGGKKALEALLASACSGQFDPAQARAAITASLNLV